MSSKSTWFERWVLEHLEDLADANRSLWLTAGSATQSTMESGGSTGEPGGTWQRQQIQLGSVVQGVRSNLYQITLPVIYNNMTIRHWAIMDRSSKTSGIVLAYHMFATPITWPSGQTLVFGAGSVRLSEA